MSETHRVEYDQELNSEYTSLHALLYLGILPGYINSSAFHYIGVKKILYDENLLEEDANIGKRIGNQTIKDIRVCKDSPDEIQYLVKTIKPIDGNDETFFFWNMATKEEDVWYHDASVALMFNFESFDEVTDCENGEILSIRSNVSNSHLQRHNLQDDSSRENPWVITAPTGMVQPKVIKTGIDRYVLSYVREEAINAKVITFTGTEILVSKEYRLVVDSNPSNYALSVTSEGVIMLVYISKENNEYGISFHHKPDPVNNTILKIHSEVNDYPINVKGTEEKEGVSISLSVFKITDDNMFILESGFNRTFMIVIKPSNVPSRKNRLIVKKEYVFGRDSFNAYRYFNPFGLEGSFSLIAAGETLREYVTNAEDFPRQLSYDSTAGDFTNVEDMNLSKETTILPGKSVEFPEKGGFSEFSMIYYDNDLKSIFVRPIVQKFASFVGAYKLQLLEQGLHSLYKDGVFTIPTALPYFNVGLFKINGVFDTAFEYYALFKWGENWMRYDSNLKYSQEYLESLEYGDLKDLGLSLGLPLTGSEPYAQIVADIVALDIRMGWLNTLINDDPENWMKFDADPKFLEFPNEVIHSQGWTEESAFDNGEVKDYNMVIWVKSLSTTEAEMNDLPTIVLGDMEWVISDV